MNDATNLSSSVSGRQPRASRKIKTSTIQIMDSNHLSMGHKDMSQFANTSETVTGTSTNAPESNTMLNGVPDETSPSASSKRPASVAFPSSNDIQPIRTTSNTHVTLAASSTEQKRNGHSETNKKPKNLAPLKRDGKNLSEKKIRRLEKNRLSARNCRRKKKEYTQNLQHEINILEGENLKLRLQLQIGQEAEQSVLEEQMRVTEELDALLKSGASDSDVHESIEEFKERFADYGRDRRSAIEYHLRNVERLLMPTTTTTVAMRALQGGSASLIMNSATEVDCKTEKEQVVKGDMNDAQTSEHKTDSLTDSKITSVDTSMQPYPKDVSKMDPKNMFQYLVNFLAVTPEQASALRDSRLVAKELDSALAQALSTLQQLRDSLSTVGQSLEHEFSEIRSILTSRQSAKFLVWVANNAPAMHMLNEVWTTAYTGQSVGDQSNQDDE